jgi:hypothetical protein
VHSYSSRPMRWWQPRGERGPNWKKGLQFWKVGTVTRERGWTSWKGRFRGSSGLEACLRQADERTWRPRSHQTTCAVVHRVLRKGAAKYVRLRTRFSRRRRTIQEAESSQQSSACYRSPTKFRTRRPPRSSHVEGPLTSLLALTILPSEFEQFLAELWKDFLIEPIPYLIAWALCYLGFVLLLGRYYMLIWRTTSLAAWILLPLDDAEWILGYS